MQRRAFTLIELLVVIAIIAILAAILFPVFAQAKNAAKKTADMSNVRQLAMGIEMWKSDHDGLYPKYWYAYELGGQDTSVPYPLWGWDYQLQAYVKNKEIFQSPLDRDTTPRGLWSKADTEMCVYRQGPSGWACAEPAGLMGNRHRDDDIPASYRLNVSDYPDGARTAMNESTLEKPAEAILIAPSKPGVDNVSWHHIATWEDPNNAATRPGAVCLDNVNNVAYDRNGPQPANPTKAQRDGGRANYGFADGHAKSFVWSATWRRIGDDVTQGSRQLTPTMWRQSFTGWTDFCGWQEGQDR